MEVRSVEFDSPEYQQTLELRNRLLRAPLGLSVLDEDLAAEREQWHYGLYEGTDLVGCVVAVPIASDTVRVRQMAIETSRQRQGCGSALLSAVEMDLNSRGITHIVLHARLAACGFYSKLGYVESGRPFIEIGIPHVEMRKLL